MYARHSRASHYGVPQYRDGEWMGNVWVWEGEMERDRRLEETDSRLALQFYEHAPQCVPRRRAKTVETADIYHHSTTMWFEGDGIPPGTWRCDIHHLRTPHAEGDANAGTALWVLCMGGADDMRAQPSTLQTQFPSSIMDATVLGGVIDFLCPERHDQPLTLALLKVRRHILWEENDSPPPWAVAAYPSHDSDVWT